MKKLTLSGLLLASVVWSGAAWSAPTMPPADPSVYKAFGEKPGLVKLVNEFAGALVADPRTRDFFVNANAERLTTQLVDQFCEVTGGPCKYQGLDMKSSHARFKINKGHYNALVEALQTAMDKQNVPFSAQRELLAQLAFMYRDIITDK